MSAETSLSKRGRLNALQGHGAAPERIEAARLELKATRAEEYIRALVDNAPPLTTDQRDRLAVLLRGAPDKSAAA